MALAEINTNGVVDEELPREADGEADNRKNLDMRTKEITKEMRKITDFNNMDEEVQKIHKDK